MQLQTEQAYPNLYRQACLRMNAKDKKDPSLPIDKMDHDDRLTKFLELFSDLKCKDIATRIREIYAEHPYFCDTLRVIEDMEELVDYMEETAKRLDQSRIIYDRVLQNGDNYFIQWYMQTEFKLFGRVLQAKSIGMSHILLDDQGKVILHQDFWDNTEGLFRHIPLLKSFYRQFKKKV